MSMPGPLELLLILLIVVLLFGAKKLPEIARALGDTLRELKNAFSGKSDKDEDKK
jgi:sec-independent protein translocase protein TatA